jgi:hypothetical protein
MDPISGDFVTLQPARQEADHDVFIRLAGNYSGLQAFRRGLSSYPFAASGSQDPAIPSTYQTSGDADDWAYEQRHRLSITVELTDEHQPNRAKQLTVFQENSVGILSYLFANMDRTMNAPLQRLQDRAGRRSR